MTEPMNELQVRLQDIISNAKYFQGLSRTSAVVKADAYGLGMEQISTALHKSGVQEFYTFSLDEAITLRKNLNGNASIHFFANLRNGTDAKTAAQHKLIPVLNRLCELQLWQEADWQGSTKPLCVHIDTGMNRLGLSLNEWSEFLEFYKQHKKDFEPPLLLSHLACADEERHPQNKVQLESAKKLLHDLPEGKLSLSASNGSLLSSDYHFHQLRIGVGLYGVTPAYSTAKLKQPLTWQTQILQIRTVQAGEFIGYGATPITKASKVAIIACGYADGLRRNFAETGTVYINGTACKMLGRISMDCSAVDITNAKAEAGDMAQIIGENQTLQVVADAMATIPYEVLCGIGQRVKRKYID